MMGIDEFAVGGVQGHRIDGEVAADEVALEVVATVGAIDAKAGTARVDLTAEVEGQKITEFQGLPKTITTDPTVAMLAPVVGIVLALGYRFSNLGLTGISGLSS